MSKIIDLLQTHYNVKYNNKISLKELCDDNLNQNGKINNKILYKI